MDYKRKPKKYRFVIRVLLTFVVLGAIASVSVGLSRLERALPSVPRQSVMVGAVERGTMVRQVRGMGTLVSEDVRWVTAEVGGRVVDVLVEPGVEVQPDTVLVKLRDPVIERAVVNAERDLESARTALSQFEVDLSTRRLDLQASTAEANANYKDAADEAEMLQELDSKGLLSKVRLNKALARKDRNWMLLELQVKRVENSNKTHEFQLREKQLAVKRAESVLEERRKDLADLTVKAGYAGILQQIGPTQDARLEVGQRVPTGEVLARITNPTRLKAVLRIAETQMDEVIIDQTAAIDTRIGIVPGRVVRIDPTAQAGEVTVDVELEGELPRGARPDLSVAGTIEIARLEDVRFMPRPVEARTDGELKLFKIEPDGKTAIRTLVRIGQTSISTVEIVDGLQQGDEVILSPMDQFAEADRLAIE